MLIRVWWNGQSSAEDKKKNWQIHSRKASTQPIRSSGSQTWLPKGITLETFLKITML